MFPYMFPSTESRKNCLTHIFTHTIPKSAHDSISAPMSLCIFLYCIFLIGCAFLSFLDGLLFSDHMPGCNLQSSLLHKVPHILSSDTGPIYATVTSHLLLCTFTKYSFAALQRNWNKKLFWNHDEVEVPRCT